MPRLPSPLPSIAVPRSCLYWRNRCFAGSDVMLPLSPSQKNTTTTIMDRTPMATHRHVQQCQRRTQLASELLRPRHKPCIGPAQGLTPKRGPYLDQKQTPEKMSTHSCRTYFRGSKVDPKSGPQNWVRKPSLLVEISGRLYLHVTTKQRSHGSHGNQSMSEALWCV